MRTIDIKNVRGGSFLDSQRIERTHLTKPPPLLEMRELYRTGLIPGASTGWKNVDEFYTVAPGMLTICTGYPSSGKSTWVDALAVNMTKQNWKWLFASFENQPKTLHAANLMAKIVKRPFSSGPTQRMTEREMKAAHSTLTQHFSFVDYNTDIDFETLIKAADQWSDEAKSKQLAVVIDPYNELENSRGTMSETDYISSSLRKLRQFARTKNIHVFVVAHPRHVRMQDNQLKVPTPDQISGSAHWWNKADFIVTVNRDLTTSGVVEIHVQKARWRHLGKIGVTKLNFDVATGTYSDIDSEIEFRK